MWFSTTMTTYRKPTTVPGKSAELGRPPFIRPNETRVGWMVGGWRLVIGFVVHTPVLVVLLSGGGGGPLGFLMALGFIPALTMVLTSLAGLPVRRIPRIRHWWIRHGEIAMVGVVFNVALTLYGFVMGHETTVMDPELSVPITLYEPEWAYSLPGWFMTSLFATYMWIPPRWKKRKGASGADKVS